jgi:uncharacterized peroxidase-related enzyme
MTHHGAALRALVKDEKLVNELARDWRAASFSEPDVALCAFAERLTLTPAAISAADVAALRRAGFDDCAILDACQVVAYFNFVIRVALGLGVELEPYWRQDEILRPSGTVERATTVAHGDAGAASGADP